MNIRKGTYVQHEPDVWVESLILLFFKRDVQRTQTSLTTNSSSCYFFTGQRLANLAILIWN